MASVRGDRPAADFALGIPRAPGASRAACTAGTSRLINTAMIAIMTSSSI
jgi:hypothetical protein